MSAFLQRTLFAASGCALLLVSGCATTCTTCCFPWLAPELPHGEVTQVMALWADGVVYQPDRLNHGKPSPGLSGRVYLFGPDPREPVVGDGALAVHLYDDAQPPTEQPAPREVWNIDEANLQRVLTKDGLGWGYNLWLPWSNYHPEIRKISLAVKFQPKVGPPAWSSSTLVAISDGSGKPRRPSQLQTLMTTAAGRRPGETKASTIRVPDTSSLSTLASPARTTEPPSALRSSTQAKPANSPVLGSPRPGQATPPVERPAAGSLPAAAP
jgi:hypothetical protein